MERPSKSLSVMDRIKMIEETQQLFKLELLDIALRLKELSSRVWDLEESPEEARSSAQNDRINFIADNQEKLRSEFFVWFDSFYSRNCAIENDYKKIKSEMEKETDSYYSCISKSLFKQRKGITTEIICAIVSVIFIAGCVDLILSLRDVIFSLK